MTGGRGNETQSTIRVQFGRVGEYQSIAEPRSGSDRVRLRDSQPTRNHFFLPLESYASNQIATAPRFCIDWKCSRISNCTSTQSTCFPRPALTGEDESSQRE